MAKAKPTFGVDPDASLLVNAAKAIGARLDAMLAYEPCLSAPERVHELHEMRIAAKRLRYTMEIFQDVYAAQTRFGKLFGDCLQEVRLLQEHLGELHDADVLVPQLTAHLASLLPSGGSVDKKGEPIVGVHLVDFHACQGLLTLCTETQAGRDTRYKQLLQDWQRLRDKKTFEKLRSLLQYAIAETMPPPSDDTETKPTKDETAHATVPPSETEDAPPAAKRRTRRPAANGNAGPRAARSGGHSRPRPHSDTRPSEGGPAQPGSAAEG